MTSNYDIAILGGGLVGLSMAAMLAREMPAARVCLVEQKAFSFEKKSADNFDARSSALSRGSVEIYRALGFGEDLEKHASVIREVHVSDRGHFGRVNYRDNAGEVLGYVVENVWLGQSLLDLCQAHTNFDLIAPATVEVVMLKAGKGCLLLQNHQARDGSVKNQAVIKENESNETKIEAELLVIADGASSPLAHQLGIETRIKDFHQSAVIANIECSEAHHGRAFERFTNEGPLALLPLGDTNDSHKCALVYTRPQEKVTETLEQNDEEFLASIQSRFGYQLGKLTRVGQRYYYPLSYSYANEQVRRSIVLVGNAAHFLHPVAGQGLNLALRDIAQLLSVLNEVYLAKQNGKSANYGELALLQNYLALQESDQILTAAISNSFNALFANNNKMKQLARNNGLLMLELFDGLKQNVFQRMMGESVARPQLKLYSSN